MLNAFFCFKYKKKGVAFDTQTPAPLPYLKKTTPRFDVRAFVAVTAAFTLFTAFVRYPITGDAGERGL